MSELEFRSSPEHLAYLRRLWADPYFQDLLTVLHTETPTQPEYYVGYRYLLDLLVRLPSAATHATAEPEVTYGVPDSGE